MTALRIRFNPRYLSDVAWDQWIEAYEDELPSARQKLMEAASACENTRALMAYNTGSVNFSTMLLLYILLRNLKPSHIFEIGTFIGKSAIAMALACDRNGNPAEIFTCDASNDFHLPKLTKTPVNGFSKTASTEALKSLLERKIMIDFVHVDGRLSVEDLPLLEQIINDDTVLALDDFEGIEKGVANYSLLRGRPKFAKHMLIYPPTPSTLEKLGAFSRSTTALLIPLSLVIFTAQ
jgi:predicted O-methyltransferase YrrM